MPLSAGTSRPLQNLNFVQLKQWLQKNWPWRATTGAKLLTADEIMAGTITTAELNFTPVGSANIIATINASAEGITITADRIAISGETTFSSGYDPSGKIKTFHQDAAPQGETAGDIWFDTNDAMKPYRWNGANGWTYSEQIDNAAWGKTGLAATPVVANAMTAPDGTETADQIVENSSLSTHYISRAIPSPGDNVEVTISGYVKPNGRSWIYLQCSNKSGANSAFCYFNVSTGATGGNSYTTGYSIEAAANGFYRVSLTSNMLSGASATNAFFALASANGTSNYTGDGASGIYLWGCQVEVNDATLSVYDKTEATAHATWEAVRDVTYGHSSDTTKIDGGKIYTGTVTADALFASYVQVGGAADDVNGGATTIDGGKLTTGTVTADFIVASASISAPTITAGTFESTDHDAYITMGANPEESSLAIGSIQANSIQSESLNLAGEAPGLSINGTGVINFDREAGFTALEVSGNFSTGTITIGATAYTLSVDVNGFVKATAE